MKVIPALLTKSRFKIALGALVAGLLVLGAVAAGAQSWREDGRPSGYDGYREGRRGGAKPVLAVVALGSQRVSIYDADGKVTEAPVSTGQPGYETPAGIFSVVQKKEDHRSNLYEDGEMPFMQRITWTGIALHAGNLPGHPASHGCVRLPMGFAQRLFDMTELGLRVVIVPNDMRPSEISHPALFTPKPVPKELALAARGGARFASLRSEEVAPGSPRHLQLLQQAAEAKAAEVEEAGRRQRAARAAAQRAAAEAATAGRATKAEEAAFARAESAAKEAQRRLEKATSPEAIQRAEEARAKALAKVGEAEDRLGAAKVQEQARREAAERADQGAKDAAAARELAAQEAREASWRTFPVSVFVSRKTQRLYVRKGNNPVFEAPVAIRDATKPIGTFVFTALDRKGQSPEMRWTVLAMYRNLTRTASAANDDIGRPGSAQTDVAAAAAALDRIGMSQEATDLISEVVLPGSSLIVSDEGLSRETGKDTDFVVVMSDEPQGALKIRQREPRPSYDDYDAPPWARSPWGGSRSPWGGFWKW
jgi:hypothetical protein